MERMMRSGCVRRAGPAAGLCPVRVLRSRTPSAGGGPRPRSASSSRHRRRIRRRRSALPIPHGKTAQPFRFRRQARARQPMGHLVRALPPRDAVLGTAADPARRQDRNPGDIRGYGRQQGGRAVHRQTRAQGGQDLSRSEKRGRPGIQGRRPADELSDRSAGPGARPRRRRGGLEFCRRCWRSSSRC